MSGEDKILSILIDMQVDIKDLKKDVAALKKDVAKLDRRVTVLEKKVSEHDKRFSDLEQIVTSLHSRHDEQVRILGALVHAVEEIGAQVSSEGFYAAKVHSLEFDVAKHEGNFAAMKRAIS